jgi:hypothetical protein
MRVSLALIVSAIVSAGAFIVPSQSLKKQKPASFALIHGNGKAELLLSKSDSDDKNNKVMAFDVCTFSPNKMIATSPSVMTMTWLATSEMAGAAAGPDWGIFEGRTGSILHPISMGTLFAMSLYTAFLGFQWRRQRTLGDEISSLKGTLPKIPSDYKTIQEALASGEIMEESLAKELQAAIPIETKIQELTAERKQLSSQNNRDKHYTQGAWIAFFGTLFAIVVCYCYTECVLFLLLLEALRVFSLILFIYMYNSRDHSIPMLELENSFQDRTSTQVPAWWPVGRPPWRASLTCKKAMIQLAVFTLRRMCLA